MPISDHAGLIKARLAQRYAGRFATRSSRFRLAVSSGFVIATVAFTGVVMDRGGFADDLFGSLGAIFGIQQQQPAPAYAQQAPGERSATYRIARHHTRDSRVTRVSSRRSTADGGSNDEPTRLGRQSMCVRLCDGFSFPVGAYHGEGDRASHEATCHSECPGAATALYVVPTGSDSINEAVNVKTGSTYSALPFAFHYTTVLNESCSCHPTEGNRIASLLRDYTLRRGDAVITPAGVRVFHGGAHFPFRQADFVPLARSRDIRGADRPAFHEIERASIGRTPTVASKDAPALTSSAGTSALEHQASR